jgi:type VI secretion system secreted protein VgrG
VIVDFLEGDPDQPIVVGSVYNADQMPPYLGNGLDPKHKNDHNVMGIKSNTTLGGEGFNEWRFVDTKGKEQLFVHAERNMDVRVKSDSMENVGGSKHVTVGGEKDGKKFGDFKQLVHKDFDLYTKGKHDHLVGGDMHLTVGGEREGEAGDLVVVVKGNRYGHISGNEAVQVDAARLEKVAGDQHLTVGGDRLEKVEKRHALEAATEIHLKAGTTFVIEAGTQLSLKVGGNFIDIGPSGISIQGTQVLINSGGAAGSGSGSNPLSPGKAKEAKPVSPTVADDSKTGFKSCS